MTITDLETALKVIEKLKRHWLKQCILTNQYHRTLSRAGIGYDSFETLNDEESLVMYSIKRDHCKKIIPDAFPEENPFREELKQLRMKNAKPR